MFIARSLVCIHISLSFGSSVVLSAEFSLGLSFGFTLGFTAFASSIDHLYNRSGFLFCLGILQGLVYSPHVIAIACVHTVHVLCVQLFS